MDIQITTKDATPVYAQIVGQVRRLIACGALTEGDELPSIRVLAEQLIVNPNTVARAYRELEAVGLVAVRRGTYTYVAATARMAEAERRSVLLNQVDILLADASQMHFSVAEIIELLRSRAAESRPADDAEVDHV